MMKEMCIMNYRLNVAKFLVITLLFFHVETSFAKTSGPFQFSYKIKSQVKINKKIQIELKVQVTDGDPESLTFRLRNLSPNKVKFVKDKFVFKKIRLNKYYRAYAEVISDHFPTSFVWDITYATDHLDNNTSVEIQLP